MDTACRQKTGARRTLAPVVHVCGILGQETQRIAPYPVVDDLKMKVRSCRATCVPHGPDLLVSLNSVASLHNDVIQVCVTRQIAVTVVNEDLIAIR